MNKTMGFNMVPGVDVDELRAARARIWTDYRQEVDAARRKAVESRAHRVNAQVLLAKHNGLGNVLDTLFCVPELRGKA